MQCRKLASSTQISMYHSNAKLILLDIRYSSNEGRAVRLLSYICHYNFIWSNNNFQVIISKQPPEISFQGNIT